MSFRDTIKQWKENQPSVWAELKAIGREAMKDVRQTMNQVMFNSSEHAPEIGTPLNPVQREEFAARHQETKPKPKDKEPEIEM